MIWEGFLYTIIRQRKAGHTKEEKRMRCIRRILVLVLLIAVCAGGFIAGKGYRMYREALEEKSLAQIRKETVEDENFVAAEQLPEIYKKAVVSVEDKRFYRHKGIDPIGIARAFYHNIRAGKLLEGGSTITQQVAKNFYFDMDQTIERKIAEMFMAVAMEKEFTKDEILELYVNHIYFGDGYDCVREASLGYFQKEPGQMTDYESTMLAGIPNAPSVYAPTKNPELAKQRQQQVLSTMVKNGMLTEEERTAILEQSE